MNELFASLSRLWRSVRSNPYFVAATSAAGGAVASMLHDEYIAGHLDFSPTGLTKLKGAATLAVFVAFWHLYQPVPGSNPNQ